MSTPQAQLNPAQRGSSGRFVKARPSPSGPQTKAAASSAIPPGSQAILDAFLSPTSDLVIINEEAPAPQSGFQAPLSGFQAIHPASAGFPLLSASAVLPLFSDSQPADAASSAPLSGVQATPALSAQVSSKFRTSADFQATVAVLSALASAPRSPSYASVVRGTGGRVLAPAFTPAINLAPPAFPPLALGTIERSAPARVPLSLALQVSSKEVISTSQAPVLATSLKLDAPVDEIDAEGLVPYRICIPQSE